MQSTSRARRESAASGPNPDAVFQDEGVPGKQPLFGRLRGLFTPKPSGKPVADPNANALLAFRSEAGLRAEPQSIGDLSTPARRRPRALVAAKFVRPLLLAAAVVVVAGLGVAVSRLLPLSPAGSSTGNLTINTGAVVSEVLVDGVGRGPTPLTLALPAGPHTLVVRSGSDERVVPLTIAAGADVSHNFDMRAAAPVAQLGGMSIATDPPGARVAVDGQLRGISPLTVTDLSAAEHSVTVTNDAGSAERTVAVGAGGTVAVVFSMVKAAGPVGGWLSITAPFEVEVFDNQDAIGSSGASRIMLAAGRHNITLSNRTLGYEEARRVDVAAGRTTAIRVEAPKASVSVNARPWADIVLDGTAVGQTPIANLSVGVGSHEMVFRHPQLGERKQTITVSVKGPNRIAVDLTQ
ncbi:MAG: PEGA domain-containing protein [Acidobacteriota bacterium]